MAWKEQIRIRNATPEDAPGILWLIQLLAEYENDPHELKIDVPVLFRDGFGEEKFFHALVAELKSPSDIKSEKTAPGLPSEKMVKNELLVGYALYYFTYSTWTGRVLYLEDVFVRADYRNKGLGSDLMRECGKIARSRGCARMTYQVYDWNTKAIRLYERIGGEIPKFLLTMRLSGDNLVKFADGQDDDSWSSDVLIRPATAEDVPGIVWLIQLLAEIQREPEGPKIGEKELLQDGFGVEKYYSLLVVELKKPAPPNNNDTPAPSSGLRSDTLTKNERLVGFVLYTHAYSTWHGRVLYIDDIYIRDGFRQKGIGRALMRECVKEAKAKDCRRIFWHVLDWNTRSIDFYERLGAKMHREWYTVIMERDALASFVGTQNE